MAEMKCQHTLDFYALGIIFSSAETESKKQTSYPNIFSHLVYVANVACCYRTSVATREADSFERSGIKVSNP